MIRGKMAKKAVEPDLERKGRSVKNRQKQVIILAIGLLLFAGVIFWLLQLGEDDAAEVGDAQNAVFSEHFLDASLSYSDRNSEETEKMLNHFDAGEVSAVELFINAGLAAGRYISLTSGQDGGYLRKLTKLFFSEDQQYIETDMWRYGTEYSFYISFLDADGKPLAVVFVIDPDTIRCDGRFYRASFGLDYNEIIREMLLKCR